MPSGRFVALSGLGLAGSYAAILGAMRFHLCLNDFWAWRFFASGIDLADPATLHNGFMPPAYAVYLRLAGPQADIVAGFAATLLSVFVVAVAIALLAGRLGGRAAALLAVIFLAVWSPFLQTGLTAGPDVVVVALVSVAVLIHWNTVRPVRSSLIAAGVLGLAVLVRGHALFAGVAVVLAAGILERRIDRAGWILAGGLGLGVLGQVLVNLAAGEAPWSSAQAFNVYKMVNGMDWYAPVVPEDLSVIRIFLDDPASFLREWAGAAARAGIWLAGPAFAWWYAGRKGLEDLRRMAALAVIGGAAYLIPVSLGDSPRAAVVLAALIVPPVAALVLQLTRSPASVVKFAGSLIIAVGLAVSLSGDRDFLAHNFRQARDFAAIEQALSARHPDSARQVFTEDFDLYFRDIEGRRPLTKGGWGLIGIEGWEAEFPQLPTADRAAFLESCADHGVRFLALTRRSRRLGPEFSSFYYDPNAVGLTVVGEYGEFVLLEIPQSVRLNEEARP